MLHARPLELKRNLALGFAAAALALLLVPHASQAMTISPPVLDFTLNPGDTLSDVVQVYNEETVPFRFTPYTQNFTSDEKEEGSGAPQFYPADEVRTGYELAPWIILKSGSSIVAAGERVNYPIDIKVPKDAKPGSYYGAVQVLAGNPGDAPDRSALSIERGVTVLVFARIRGDVREELGITRFSGDKGFYTHLPVDFHLRLSNTGNTHLRPTGNIFIKDMFGRQVATPAVNPGPDFRTVLPGTSRRFDISWFKKNLPDDTSEYRQQIRNFGFGKYEATLALNYGPSNKVMTAVWTFWVIPWMALLTYALAFIALAFIAYTLFRAYNKSLISSYEKRTKQ